MRCQTSASKGSAHAAVLLTALVMILAPVRAAYSWKNVHTGGGGGFTSGIVFHPKAKALAYARTDIGGLYRMNPDNSWTPVTDSIATDAGWNRLGIDALALDPQDPNKVYAAVGTYTNSWDPNSGSIIRSSDRGNTWALSSLPFKVGGNMPGRGMGERLAVDPANSKILYFGARSGKGLWKSTDGGVTFSKVTSFTSVGTYVVDPNDSSGYQTDIVGLAWVTFDSTSGSTSGATSRIFVGVADNKTASVWVSNDAGSTWDAVAGQPGTFFPHKGKIQTAEKALYVTYSDGVGPYDGKGGALYRYDIPKGTWKNITPVNGSELYFGFGGLGLDTQKPGTLVVAALNSWFPEAQMFRSTDSGATWSRLWEWTSYPNRKKFYSISTPLAPWIDTSFNSQPNALPLGWMIEALEIDPFDSNHWLYGTGLTIYGGNDLTSWDSKQMVTIQSLADGIEETSVQEVISIPGGSELLLAVGDNCGWTYKSSSDLGTSPKSTWMTPKWSTSNSVDYAGNSIAKVVRVGSASEGSPVALSNDGGVSWNAHSDSDTSHKGGRVAYSADADTIVWSTDSNGVLRSQDQSKFSAVSSLPSGAVIASDRRKNNYFYAASASAFYVSVDAGGTFSKGGPLSGATETRDVAAHPTTAGEVWVSTDAGLFRSTDFGRTFTAVGQSTLRKTQQVAFGLGSSPKTWYLYAFGVGVPGAGLYASADTGASWTYIQGSQGFGLLSKCQLAGSGNVPGQVYVGTNGRGAFYASGPLGGKSGGSPTTMLNATVTAKGAAVTLKTGVATAVAGKSSSCEARKHGKGPRRFD